MFREGVIVSGCIVPLFLVPVLAYLSPNKIPVLLRINFFTKDPVVLSQSMLISIFLMIVSIKLLQRRAAKSQETGKDTTESSKPKSIRRLQVKFLVVFWLLRFAFWMAGPYFYAAFASKMIDGKQMTLGTISQISLTGYAVIALLGPLTSKISQSYGKRIATMLGMLFYGLGSFSVTANSLLLLFMGRACAGLGQSILSNAPESWFVSEAKQKDRDPKGLYLSETFGVAYSMDSVVAIIAGQMAQWSASSGGPTAPFSYSPLFLIVGFMVVVGFWSEGPATIDTSKGTQHAHNYSIQDAIRIIFADPKIFCLGIVQSCFEAAMYIFVLSWAPLMEKTIYDNFGDTVPTPYGQIFSCFMAACMLGSTLFTIAVKIFRLERVVVCLLAMASLSLFLSLWSVSHTSTSLAVFRLFLSYVGFETCVGMYFPSIGTLRATILPDSHRSAIMTLFAVPLNVMVVTVFLLLDKLGHRGGVAVAAVILAAATLAMISLDRQSQSDRRKQTLERFQKIANKVILVNTICTEFSSRLGGNGQVYMTDGAFCRQESRSSFASLNAPM